ncbi:NB-ARC domain-containing protein [Gimesia maris]|uniref:NB-ARC domain-containing protein n=1 Tax=Gimesia maris TaxID=122 RepID=UPI003A8D27FB
MNPSHRTYLINELSRGIQVIGPHFEAFGQKITDYLIDEPLTHRGLNAQGLPVGHIIDSFSVNGEIAAEYSAEQNYFEKPLKKLFGDFKHVRTNHPQANRIYLLSAQECGPKLYTRLTNLCFKLEKKKGLTVAVYDSRRIAEFIVDDLLLNDEAVETLSPLLVPLERVCNEYAVTKLVPSQSDNYIRQDSIIDEISSQIREHRVSAIAGVSGSGKSETAVAVSKALESDFEIIIWVVATDLKNLTELRGFDVERRGRKVNVDSLLKERSCLLILDDFRKKNSVDELKQYTGTASAILITRQTTVNNDYQIPFLDDADAETILQNGIDIPCPEHIAEKVRQTAGGHPLALRLMNAGVRESSWEDLEADCEEIGQYEDDERFERLADRLLDRLRPLMEKELALFLWCNSDRVDRSFARRTIAPVGIRKLESSCLLSADRQDVIRLHEIIWSSLRSIDVSTEKYEAYFTTCIENHIEHLAFAPGESLNFLIFRQVHHEQLQQILESNNKRSTCLYCLTHTWSDEDVNTQLLPNPIDLYADIESGNAKKDIDVSAFCEVVECIYRRIKFEDDIEAARKMLSSHLDLYSKIAEADGISPKGQSTALHHKAKALKNLRQFEEAKQLCKELLSKFDNPATKLLYARLLRYGDQKDILHAKDLLLDILNEAQEKPNEAEISVVLASIETLGYNQLSKAIPNILPEAFDRFGELVADLIMSSAPRGFDLAYVAFASIGRKLRYHDEPLFFEILSNLQYGRPEDACDDKERAAWGDILLSASDSREIGTDECKGYATAALEYYNSIKEPFKYTLQQKGHCLVNLNRPADARETLQPLVADEPNPWNRYWLSKVELLQGNHDVALTLIDESLADPKSKQYQTTFLEHRFDIRNARGDTDAIEDLKQAQSVCTDPKHKASIANKLETLQASTQPME